MESTEYPNYKKFFRKPSNSPKNALDFIWLGQAGFAFRYNNTTHVVDPYLSNYLSKKYQDWVYPHVRLMDIPIQPEHIKDLDFLLLTHSHSDHMDPETLPAITKTNPHVKIIIPAPAMEEAVKHGAPTNNIILAFSEKTIKINSEIEIIPIPAAHEELKTDENGHHFYLGYIFRFGNRILYHSGDCVPYDGLLDLLIKYEVNLAFLPINGRDQSRRANNIAGNFYISEVLELCKDAKISQLVVHHFGMFAYNTVTNEQLGYIKSQSNTTLEIIIPEVFRKYSM